MQLVDLKHYRTAWYLRIAFSRLNIRCEGSMVVPCPLCQKKRFKIFGYGRMWKCFGCDQFGDAVTLLSRVLLIPLPLAAAELSRLDGTDVPLKCNYPKKTDAVGRKFPSKPTAPALETNTMPRNPESVKETR